MRRASTEETPKLPVVLAERLALVDAVDHLLNRGAVLVGDATLSLAGVDLVYVGLSVLISSVETLRRDLPEARQHPAGRGDAPPRTSGLASAPGSFSPPARVLETPPVGPPSLTSSTGLAPPASTAAVVPGDSSERPEQGLARLVLTLVELLRQVLERQAIRRMEGGGLSDDDVERMGVALLELESKMVELRDVFGITPEDVNVDLGPLGKLL